MTALDRSRSSATPGVASDRGRRAMRSRSRSVVRVMFGSTDAAMSGALKEVRLPVDPRNKTTATMVVLLDPTAQR